MNLLCIIETESIGLSVMLRINLAVLVRHCSSRLDSCVSAVLFCFDTCAVEQTNEVDNVLREFIYHGKSEALFAPGTKMALG